MSLFSGLNIVFLTYFPLWCLTVGNNVTFKPLFIPLVFMFILHLCYQILESAATELHWIFGILATSFFLPVWENALLHFLANNPLAVRNFAPQRGVDRALVLSILFTLALTIHLQFGVFNSGLREYGLKLPLLLEGFAINAYMITTLLKVRIIESRTLLFAICLTIPTIISKLINALTDRGIIFPSMHTKDMTTKTIFSHSVSDIIPLATMVILFLIYCKKTLGSVAKFLKK